MHVILIPGLWLDASSWDDVVPALRDAGHTVEPVTPPGVGEPASLSSGIGIADWVSDVVARVDAAKGPVAVVGHSGGGNVAWGAADARPDRVARVVLVDTIPPYPGASISEFPVVDGVIPFPGWDFFDDEDTFDLDAAARDEHARRMRSVPARVPSDALSLDDPARHAVPVTLLMGQLDEAEFRRLVANWGPHGTEFAAIEDAEVVRLGSAHWPQFSRREILIEALVAALR